MASFEIRTARIEDAAGCAELVTTLGYATSAPQMRTRLERLLARHDSVGLVAEEPAGGLVGLSGGSITPVWESDRLVGRLDVLVVAERARGAGVGSALVAAVEDWLRTRGAEAVVLTSGQQRHEAHRFYVSRGYRATGIRLMKPLMA